MRCPPIPIYGQLRPAPASSSQIRPVRTAPMAVARTNGIVSRKQSFVDTVANDWVGWSSAGPLPDWQGVKSDVLSRRTYERASGSAEKCHSHFVRVSRLDTICSSRYDTLSRINRSGERRHKQLFG